MPDQRASEATWDALAQDDLSGRASVSLQRAYPADGLGNRLVYLGCRTDGQTYSVESGQLLAWNVTRVSGGGPVIGRRSADSLDWPADSAS